MLSDKENVDFGKILSRNGLSKTSFRKTLIKLFCQTKSSLSIDEIINIISYKVDPYLSQKLRLRIPSLKKD